MSFFKLSMLAGVAAISIAAVSPAGAATISGGSVGINNTPTDYNTALGNLSLFNTALGNLTSVTFTWGYGFTSTITVNAATASDGDVQTVSASQFRSDNAAVNNVINSLVNTITNARVGSQNLAPAAYRALGEDQGYSLAGGTSRQFASNYAYDQRTVTNGAQSTLDAFSAAGGGTFDVLARTLTGTTGTQTGGNATITQTTTATQNFAVSYNYDVPPPVTVPEPASIALLGAGLLGLGMIRRKSV